MTSYNKFSKLIQEEKTMLLFNWGLINLSRNDVKCGFKMLHEI